MEELRRGPTGRPGLGFVVDELEGRAGTELHLLHLLQGLNRQGFRCELLILGRNGLTSLFRGQGISVHHLPVRRVLTPTYPLLVVRLGRWLRRQQIGLVETIHVASDLLGPLAARAVGIPCVSSRRDLGIFRAARHRTLARWTNRAVTAFLAPSEAVREFTCRAEQLDPRRFLVIHNGVDSERFRPGRERNLREQLGIPPGAPVVGAVASLSPAKRPLVLLDAFSRLVRGAHPDAHLIYAGQGPLSALVELQSRAAGLGRQVHLIGGLEQPEQAYAALDVHALASGSEGFSNTLLEAMACGLPVVATRVGGNPEVVRDGISGLLVPPDDSEALAAALDRVLGHPGLAAALGERARSQITRDFTLQRMVDRHASFFRTLLSPRHGTRSGPGPRFEE